MKKTELKGLLKNENPQNIIYKHIHGKIYLTDNQVKTVLNLKNKNNKK